MWILESLTRVPLKRYFLVLIGALGAEFLLLAHAFHVNPFFHPLTYAVLALALYFSDRTNATLLKACLLPPAIYGLAYFLMPRYPMVFAAAVPAVIGWILHRTRLRWWKWAAATALFYTCILITGVWQQMSFVYQYVPFLAVPLVHGTTFSFCAGCSFLPFLLRKDRVVEAIDSTSWIPREEAEKLARKTLELYRDVREQLSDEPSMQNEVEDFCEKTILICRRLDHAQRDIAQTKPEELENQIGALRAKFESVSDPIAKKQYEQALTNKEKQRRQFESLQNKAERMRAQVMHFISGLENMRFAYANREFRTAGDTKESIEFLLNLTRAENVYETSEAYQHLL